VPGSPCKTVVYCTVFVENELLSFCTVTHYTQFGGKFSVWIYIPNNAFVDHKHIYIGCSVCACLLLPAFHYHVTSAAVFDT